MWHNAARLIVAGSTMDLICYLCPGWAPMIRPASATRDWMDGTQLSFAYRCLPLNIANAHGWEILSPVGFEAIWNGGPNLRPGAPARPAGAPGRRRGSEVCAGVGVRRGGPDISYPRAVPYPAGVEPLGWRVAQQPE